MVSVGIDNTVSIITNTIPVSSWYHHDRVLTVFCLSSIIIAPILVIFTKPLMPNKKLSTQTDRLGGPCVIQACKERRTNIAAFYASLLLIKVQYYYQSNKLFSGITETRVFTKCIMNFFFKWRHCSIISRIFCEFLLLNKTIYSTNNSSTQRIIKSWNILV